MYVYSDFKTREPQARRNSPINKSISFFGSNNIKQTINREKESLNKKNHFLESYTCLSNKKTANNTLSANNKSIQTHFSEFASKTMKNSSSSFNFNTYTDSYRNWVNGIKNFSSTLSEKKWQTKMSSAKEKNMKHGLLKRNPSLSIQKIFPLLDSDNVIAGGEILSIFPKKQDSIKSYRDNPYFPLSENLTNEKKGINTSRKDIKSSLLASSGIPTDTSPKSLANTIYASNRFNINIPKFKNVLSHTFFNSASKNQLSNRKQRSSADETKIIYSRVSNREDLNKTNSAQSSNHSLNDSKKEEIIKRISFRKSNTNIAGFSNEIKAEECTKEVEVFHNKIFDKKIKAKFNQTKIDCTNKPYLEYIDGKVDSMKDKIILMKGVFDYVYPKIVLKKAEEITNLFKKFKVDNKIKPLSAIKSKEIFEKGENKNFPFQIQNFKSSSLMASKYKDNNPLKEKGKKTIKIIPPSKNQSKRDVTKPEGKKEKVISPFNIKSFI